MNIQSTFEKDIRSPGKGPGAYEWWYFDALSDDGEVGLVIIFYEGNPFSRRYMQHQKEGRGTDAHDFPAISISVYESDEPVYYSFTEVKKTSASFGNDLPELTIGDHQMKGTVEGEELVYSVHLDEELPSGDAIKGTLTFRGGHAGEIPPHSGAKNPHHWHLIQQHARVEGTIRCSKLSGVRTIDFRGSGYHDHNMGGEPLHKQFDEWYWGRFHFNNYTLIYYLMHGKQSESRAWLIPYSKNMQTKEFDTIQLSDYGRSLYGLKSARKVNLMRDDTQVMVQHQSLLDNGPFYQRYRSAAFLKSDNNKLQKSDGISEYIRPPRINNSLFWPLTNMRIRYTAEGPHWVQQSKRLYRWTW